MVEVACWDNRSFRFSPDSTALLVIDMQHDFLAPDGYIAVTYGDAPSLAGIVPRVSAVLGAARKAGTLVIHTREGYAPDGSDVNAAKRALAEQPIPDSPWEGWLPSAPYALVHLVGAPMKGKTRFACHVAICAACGRGSSRLRPGSRRNRLAPPG